MKKKKTPPPISPQRKSDKPRKSGAPLTLIKPITDDKAVPEQSIAPTINESSSTLPSFPIVGIGASAGGLAAYEEFLINMPPDNLSGIALVLIQHLDPSHKSILTDLVQKYTKMPVFEVANGMIIKPNSTYVIPPNKDMALLNGKLYLFAPSMPRGLRLAIDFFFRSLARECGEQAICIILSGAGTDGTLGMRAIKEVNGMAMVQKPETAAYDGMPRNALSTGLADYVLAPRDMPAHLIAYVNHAFLRKQKVRKDEGMDSVNLMQQIFVLLRNRSGHDFSFYKQNTTRRRIERRMAVNEIERLDHYVQFLRLNPNEVDVLFRELLIGVTGFFRDPEAFEILNEQAIRKLVRTDKSEMSIRVWVPGCSTGEEAYSIAILLQEQVDETGLPITLQVFATDIDQEAIDKARAGLYPASIAADISLPRLSRYFVAEGDNFYRIKKGIRDILIFAEQDVIKDPPFSKIDLISCRNLLIYMEGELQKKVIPIFHYALNAGGFLFLGSSESIGEFNSLFTPIDRKWKLFVRQDAFSSAGSLLTEIPFPASAKSPYSQTAIERLGNKGKKLNICELTERILLNEYSPPCVTVNNRGEIIYVHGRTGKYLELAAGEVNMSIFKTAREGLRMELSSALRKAAGSKMLVRIDGVNVNNNFDNTRVNLTIKPIDAPDQEAELYLVIFEEVDSLPESENKAPVSAIVTTDSLAEKKDRQIAALEHDLRVKEEYLQTTIEELETTNEELKSANEELQSTNEEMQSTNEELETSKEELQSVNEELITVNNELQGKIDALSLAQNDMSNLLTGTGIGTIFVDQRLLVQRFTPAAAKIINLIQVDVGRPLSNIVTNLMSGEPLLDDIQAVLNDLIPREAEIQIKNGDWYLMRILPYRTCENVIEGVVITFFEITELKSLQQALRESQASLKNVLEETGISIWKIDSQSQLTMANTIFFQDIQHLTGQQVNLGDFMPPPGFSPSEFAAWKIRYVRALNGETFREAIGFKSPTGEEFFREYAFSPYRNPNGQVVGVTCSGRDINRNCPVNPKFHQPEAASTESNIFSLNSTGNTQ